MLNPRGYSLVAGGLLFAFGIVGFAFRSNFALPDKYLVAALILGFWGVVSGFGGREESSNN